MNSWKTSFDVRKEGFLQALYENCVQKTVGIEVKGYGNSHDGFLGWVKTALILTANIAMGWRKATPMFIPIEVSKETISQPHHVLSRSCVRGYNEHLISPYEIPRVIPEYPF